MTTKIYLAHSLSTTGEFNDSKRVAKLIREIGYDVYVASENLKINDKKNDPTPIDIYDGDIPELLTSDIVVVNLNGLMQDGTITEVGVLAGWNEANKLHPKTIIGYTSNARLLQPQFYKGVPSASANHLTLGAIEKWGEFVGNEMAMLQKLGRIIQEIG